MSSDPMSGALEASRDSRPHHPYGGGDRRGGGGFSYGRGRGGRGRGRGRGGFRGRGRGYRGGYRGGGGGRHHHRGGGRGGDHEDPNTRLLRQLSVMVSRVGELKPPGAGDSGADADLRPVVAAEAKNISDLTNVVCKTPSNLATFLKFVKPPPPPPPPPPENSFLASAESATSPVPPANKLSYTPFVRTVPPQDQAGPLAHLIVSCAATLPLQTPCYAALTLAVHSHSNSSEEYLGFASRCVCYTMHRLSYDLDQLLVGTALDESDRAKMACRVKLLLRYLALLAQLQVVQGQAEDNQQQDDAGSGETITSYTLLGMLQALVQAAARPQDEGVKTCVPQLLAYLVLSTIPYLLSTISYDVLQEQLVDPLVSSAVASYSSAFTPGIGMTAILLKDEQVEGNDEEEEEDAEDDDDEAGSSGQVCDSLQDLLRSVQLLLKQKEEQPQDDNSMPKTRFALLTDAPWKGVMASAPAAMESGEGGDNAMAGEQPPPEEAPVPTGLVAFEETPLRLFFAKEMQSLALLLNNNNLFEQQLRQGTAKFQSFSMEVVVFGRLPMFGAPADAQQGDEDDDEEDMEDEPANEHVAAYTKEFGTLDRYFLADAIRDLLCCHESSISPIGQERGSAKFVAEQIWSIGQVYLSSAAAEGPTSSAEAPKGMEYGVIEALLALIVQSSASSTFRQIFLSRVLLELTRLQPTLMSPALAIAVSSLFQDYMPTLVPSARYCLSTWFAFHLINTDYQWPAAYWAHWQTYASSAKETSRGAFVQRALAVMMENLYNPGTLVKECIPPSCGELATHILPTLPPPEDEDNKSALAMVEKEIKSRLWENDELPDSLKGFILGEEVSEMIASADLDVADLNSVWARSGILLRSLLQPLVREHRRLHADITKAHGMLAGSNSEDDNAMNEDEEYSEDVLASVMDVLALYGPVLTSVGAKDAEVLKQQVEDPDENLLSSCDSYLLSQVEAVAGFSRTMVDGCVDSLLRPRLVSSLGVLHWVLGDIGGSDQEQVEQHSRVVEQWWEFSIAAIRNELINKVADTTNTPTDGGMVIDRSGADSGMDTDGQLQNVAKAMAVIEEIGPLLSYIVRRACTLLAGQQQGSKLNPSQVALVEGVKFCVRASHNVCFSQLKRSAANDMGISESEIKECLSRSSISGWKLGSICEEFDGAGLSLLRECLTNM